LDLPARVGFLRDDGMYVGYDGVLIVAVDFLEVFR
jgi:hypothetical protein